MFGKKELIARVHALLRRYKENTRELEAISFDGVSINFLTHEAKRGKTNLLLTAREFHLLQFFLKHEGEVVTREQLLNNVWGYDSMPTTRTVDNYILSLRKKIEKIPSKPKHLLTVHTAGYKFVR